MTVEPVQLFHFTCRHSAAQIRKEGLIRPHRLFGQHWMPRLTWLTDDPDASHESLFGKPVPTSELACDRTEFQFVVEVLAGAMPWRQFVREHPSMSDVARALALAPGVDHQRWWVTQDVIRVPKAGDPCEYCNGEGEEKVYEEDGYAFYQPCICSDGLVPEINPEGGLL